MHNHQHINESSSAPPARRERLTSWKYFGLGLSLTIVLGIGAMVLTSLPGVAVIGDLTVAMLLGLIWSSLLGFPKKLTPGIKFSSQNLLRYGIILVGVRLNFALVVFSGMDIFTLDMVLILFGTLVAPRLLQKLGLSKQLAFLICIGQSVCGASAIGAIASLFPDKDEDEVPLAIALCRLAGTVGVFLFPFADHLFALSPRTYGVLVGSTLHEIAQVVATGPAGGAGAADMAMLVKFTRVLFLVPIAMVTAFVTTVQQGKQSGQSLFRWKNVPIPWFILGFIAVGAMNSLRLFPPPFVGFLLQASTFLTVIAMAAMGLLIDLKVIRRTGLKALGVSLLLFLIFIAASSLIMVAISILDFRV